MCDFFADIKALKVYFILDRLRILTHMFQKVVVLAEFVSFNSNLGAILYIFLKPMDSIFKFLLQDQNN